MLERLSRHVYFVPWMECQDIYKFQLHPKIFTCLYGTFAYRRMPIGLCNAPATFQRCMMSIFDNFIEDIMEVFLFDFSIFGDFFDNCLKNLEKVLALYEETNLVLTWEKCYFMV